MLNFAESLNFASICFCSLSFCQTCKLDTHLVFFTCKHVCSSEVEVLENVARTKFFKK